MAQHRIYGERRDHTIQPTALVHEAYLVLVKTKSVEWADRTHFFAVAGRVMRRILIDYARQRGAAKRPGGQRRQSLRGHKPAAWNNYAMDAADQPDQGDFQPAPGISGHQLRVLP